MTAEHEGADGARGADGAGEYGGMDALMAAITGDPLPEEAHRDPAFRTGHRAAEADVALLRDRLHWLAEALTGERASEGAGVRGSVAGKAGAGPAVAGDGGARPAGTGDAAAGERVAGRAVAGGAAVGDAVVGEAVVGEAVAGRAAVGDAVVGEAVAGRAAVGDAVVGEAVAGEAVAGRAEARGAGSTGAGGPGGAGGGVAGGGVPRRGRSRTRPAGRPPGARRALRIALGSLAGAAAFSLVLGLGWLVTRAGGGADDSGGSSKSAADSAGKGAGDGGRPADAERELACSRLVVEGTVAKVRRLPDSPASRVTLTVLRSYKPARGPAEVAFLLDGGTQPAPRTGQRVVVGVGRGEEEASVWALGDAQVAAARAWITDTLPGSRHTSCP
ncbi:hypothetical protein [Streptomyces dangxiongensis]|uniref:hypothetical protein n=1 Tax=Streptomyces dangxiongensis TaxID=1442032 RepID=UPI001969FBF8|nr:hypothetical protein [Streptomyces dangxiongensis]